MDEGFTAKEINELLKQVNKMSNDIVLLTNTSSPLSDIPVGGYIKSSFFRVSKILGILDSYTLSVKNYNWFVSMLLSIKFKYTDLNRKITMVFYGSTE